MPFTPEELEELRRFDEQIDAEFFLTQDEIVQSRQRDRDAEKELISTRAAYCRAYYKANREKILEKHRTYYQANRDRIILRSKVYNEANREAICQRQRTYHKANREKINARKRAYREAHRDEINAKQRAARQADPEKVRAYHRAYYAKRKAAASAD